MITKFTKLEASQLRMKLNLESKNQLKLTQIEKNSHTFSILKASGSHFRQHFLHVVNFNCGIFELKNVTFNDYDWTPVTLATDNLALTVPTDTDILQFTAWGSIRQSMLNKNA